MKLEQNTFVRFFFPCTVTKSIQNVLFGYIQSLTRAYYFFLWICYPDPEFVSKFSFKFRLTEAIIKLHYKCKFLMYNHLDILKQIPDLDNKFRGKNSSRALMIWCTQKPRFGCFLLQQVNEQNILACRARRSARTLELSTPTYAP